jgi:SOS-response transcriptional repressor LexA
VAGVGKTSKSDIHRLVHGLIDRGYIRSMPGQARALEVLRNPDGTARMDVFLTAAEQKVIAYLRANPAAFRNIEARCRNVSAN